MNRIYLHIFAGVILSATSISNAATIVMSDFDDGTLQGWTQEPVSGWTLAVTNTGGNPNGFMSASDEASGSRLFAVVPGISGDLTSLVSIQWDEYLYDISNIVKGTNIFIRGTDGTLWESDRSIPSLETWVNKSVSFTNPLAWSIVSGTGSASFDMVIANADGLFINMGTSTAVVGLESGVDNIMINAIPVPAAIWLFGTALLGLVGFSKRKKAA